jgi:hypothetical protein
LSLKGKLLVVSDGYFIIITVVHYGVKKSRTSLKDIKQETVLRTEGLKGLGGKRFYIIEAGYQVLVQKNEGGYEKPYRVSRRSE